VAAIIASWASLYSNHATLRTAIEFLHVGGLVAAGGCAVAADRIALRAARHGATARTSELDPLEGTHRVVVAGLVAVIASGWLMFGADVDTFLYSKLFWLKMTLMVLLLVNGSLLRRAERDARAGDTSAWERITLTAKASIALWAFTTLVGTALPNFG
jgi:hypothetical protein